MTDRLRRPLGVAVLVAPLAVLLLAVMAAPAFAHAVLVGTQPGDGQVLEDAPAEVRLQFSEPVDLVPQSVQVFDADGGRVDAGDAAYGDDRSVVRASLTALPDGAYVAAWRVVSADGHPIRGAFTFVVGDADAVAPAPEAFDRGQPGWELAAGVARWLTYAGTLLAVGGLVFLVLVHDRETLDRPVLVRAVVAAAAVGAAGSVIGVPLHAALATGLGWSAIADGQRLADTLGSAYGLSTLVRIGGLALLLAAVARLWASWAQAVGLVGGALAVASYLLIGHTATSEPRALVLASNFAHTAAAAVWFGGLVLLVLALRARRGVDDPAAARLASRFSAVALVAVAVVALAGGALAWVEVRSLRGLVTTAYGWALAAKLAVVVVVLALAAYNRRRLVPELRSGGPASSARLLRTARLEAVGIVVVLFVTAALVNLVPARVEAGIGEPHVAYHPLGPDHELNLVVDPAEPGVNEVHLYVLDEAGTLAHLGADVQLRFSLPDAGIEAIERTPSPAGPGHFLHIGPELSIRGVWELDVVVQISDFERLSVTAEVPVGVARRVPRP